MIVVEFTLDSNIGTIWNDPAKILPYLTDWILAQRWMGTNTDEEPTLIEKDEIILSKSNTRSLIGYILGLNDNQTPQLNYFVPIEIVRAKQPEYDLPITLKCIDGTLYVGPAELNPFFFEVFLENLGKNREFRTPKSYFIQFQELSSKTVKPQTVRSMKLLGGGDTTNTVYQIEGSDGKKMVFKIFRILSTNPETIMVKKLYLEGFHHVPRPLGRLTVKIGHQTYPLILVSEYINATGDGGIVFWNDLNSQLAKWEISNEIKTNNLLKTCEKLGQIVADLHYYSSKINDDFFKPESIHQNDITEYKKTLKNLIQPILNQLQIEPLIEKKLHPFLITLEKHMKRLLNHTNWQLLNGIMKIKIHQDLHLAQMLTVETIDGFSYVILDFEGDPLLTPDEKLQKDPTFRDLAAISNAFHYISYNALKKYFSGRSRLQDDKFFELYLKSITPLLNSSAPSISDLKVIEFAKKWKKFNQNSFISSYLNQLKEHKVSFQMNLDNLDTFQYLLKIFRLERFLKELRYEIHFRKHNISVPLAGLFETFENNFA